MKTEHLFEDEDGEDLVPIDDSTSEYTYEVLKTWVDFTNDTVIFTHRLRQVPDMGDAHE